MINSFLHTLESAILRGEQYRVCTLLSDDNQDNSNQPIDKLLGLVEVAIHSTLNDATIIALAKMAIKKLPRSESDEVGISYPDNIQSTLFKHKRHSIRKVAEQLLRASLMPNKIYATNTNNGKLQFRISTDIQRNTREALFDFIIDNLSWAVKIRPLTREIAAANSAGIIDSLYRHACDDLHSVAPEIYEHAFSANSLDVIIRLKHLNMPTLIDCITKNPFVFLKDVDVVRKESLALHALLNHPVDQLVNHITSEKEARLLMTLRNVAPYDLLSSCNTSSSKNVILSLL